MTKEQFSLAHAEVCSKIKSKTSKKRNPSARRQCGKHLYDFLIKHGIELDIYYNQRKSGKSTPPISDEELNFIE